jgi:hypothetical protein
LAEACREKGQVSGSPAQRESPISQAFGEHRIFTKERQSPGSLEIDCLLIFLLGPRARNRYDEVSMSFGGPVGQLRRKHGQKLSPLHSSIDDGKTGSTSLRSDFRVYSTAFRIASPLLPNYRRFDRGDLPIHMSHLPGANAIMWMKDPATLDHMSLLPIFVDGLRETVDPYRFLAFQGCVDLIRFSAPKLLQIIPTIIFPLKRTQ